MRNLKRKAAIKTRAIAVALAIMGLTADAASAQQADLLDYPGTALRGFLSAEFTRPLDDCRRICLERSGCTGFDHSSTTNVCRIFAGIDSAEPQAGSTSGTRNRIPGYTDPQNGTSWQYARFSRVDLWGGDLVPKGLEMFDAQSCERACEGEASCRAFTFNHARNRCFLKTGYSFVQAFSDGTSGLFYETRFSDRPISLDVEWELYLESDLSGVNLVELRTGSYLQCLNECKPDLQCGGFTYVHAPKPERCLLKYGSDLRPVRNSSSHRMTSARKAAGSLNPDFVRQALPKE